MKLLREICADASSFNEIPILLLIGPAGFGKTSFCKWQALNSAAKVLANQGNTLPVYVALSRFASSSPGSAGEAFFESSELKQLLADRTQKTRIQLLLDGLDEIPDERRQNAIIDLARSVPSMTLIALTILVSIQAVHDDKRLT